MGFWVGILQSWEDKLWQVPEPREVRGENLGMGLAGKYLNMEGLNGKPYQYIINGAFSTMLDRQMI